MKITSRFTVALHTLICIAYFSNNYKVTSNFIAGSVNVNPVVIRRILGQLKEAEIVSVEAGIGGASIVKNYRSFTLLDIFKAVECVEGNFFNFHENPNPLCPVGNIIHSVLDPRLEEIQNNFEKDLQSVTFEMLMEDVLKKIPQS